MYLPWQWTPETFSCSQIKASLQYVIYTIIPQQIQLASLLKWTTQFGTFMQQYTNKDFIDVLNSGSDKNDVWQSHN